MGLLALLIAYPLSDDGGVPELDFSTMFVAFAGVGLAVLFSIAAGIVSARVFFHASREAQEDRPL